MKEKLKKGDYFLRAASIQTTAQARAIGKTAIPRKSIRLPVQGFNTMAAARGKRMDRTRPALIFMEKNVTDLVFFLTGAGLNILGRIRIPVIKRIKTRISLMPVKVYSFVKGLSKWFYISKNAWFVNLFPCPWEKKRANNQVCTVIATLYGLKIYKI